MYVLDDFKRTLRSFVNIHAALDIDIKLTTIKQHVNGHIRFFLAEDLQNLVQKLMDHLEIIDRCSFSPDYLSIWLKKELWISMVVKEILNSGSRYGMNKSQNGTVISVEIDECNNSVTCLRAKLLKNTIQNFAKVNGYVIGSNGLNLLVSKKNNPKNSNLILCGNVLCDISVDEYKQWKQDIISKTSANRIEQNEYPINIISKLCYISIVYELLSVRHNKVVNMKSGLSNKDIGIFIMYNYSRLCQIWSTYEKGVIKNHYDPLPNIDTINFGLLTNEEEWLLVLNYLSAYPSVIQESIKYMLLGNVDIHKVCKFLIDMSSAVSLFYHRHHILSDPIPNVLPLMYARLYLVKTSIQVYNNVFQLLGIEAVCEM